MLTSVTQIPKATINISGWKCYNILPWSSIQPFYTKKLAFCTQRKQHFAEHSSGFMKTSKLTKHLLQMWPVITKLHKHVLGTSNDQFLLDSAWKYIGNIHWISFIQTLMELAISRIYLSFPYMYIVTVLMGARTVYV